MILPISAIQFRGSAVVDEQSFGDNNQLLDCVSKAIEAQQSAITALPDDVVITVKCEDGPPIALSLEGSCTTAWPKNNPPEKVTGIKNMGTFTGHLTSFIAYLSRGLQNPLNNEALANQ